LANVSGADLSGADLSGTDLSGTDLSRADLSGAILSGAILSGAILSRAILSGTDLSGTDLSGTDLSGTDLSRANLSTAHLIRTQALGTNFTGANFTGACLEDWNINSATKLDDIDCQYVYLRSDKQECRPSSGEFAPGEFTKLFQKALSTIDLIFRNGVDWEAFAYSFTKIQIENADEELSIQSIENKGDGVVVVRVNVSSSADKPKTHSDFIQCYDLAHKVLEERYKAELNNKDAQIVRYGEEVQRQGEYINNLFYLLNQQQTVQKVMAENPGKVSNYNFQNPQFAGSLVDAQTVHAYQIGGDITNYNQVARTEANNSPVKTILILAANPKNTSPLRLGEEVREIDAGLQRAKKRELFHLKQRWAVRAQEVYQSLLDFKPQIVHFSGHGAGDDGLALEDETGNVQLVGTDALAKLFELFASNIECVVLNACYSEVQAQAIVKHIPYVIGMNKQIGDKAAIKFATGFYSALGAGESVEFAYKLGCSVIQLDGIPENLTPALKKKQ
jgi:uncharacterized protein YjbI with pentapeptide repeats